MKNFTISDLKDITNSSYFQKELKEMSSYLASIKQERPIVYLLAKCLQKRGFVVELEKKKCDLTVNNSCRIEAKFFYISDSKGLGEELDYSGNNIENLKTDAETATNWKIAPKIIKDIKKEPDMFIIVIASRDLKDLERSSLDKVNYAENELDYKRMSNYTDEENLNNFTRLFELIREDKNFKNMPELVKIDTKSIESTIIEFQSIYYFYIWDLRKLE